MRDKSVQCDITVVLIKLLNLIFHLGGRRCVSGSAGSTMEWDFLPATAQGTPTGPCSTWDIDFGKKGERRFQSMRACLVQLRHSRKFWGIQNARGHRNPSLGTMPPVPRRLLAVVAEADVAYPGLRYGRNENALKPLKLVKLKRKSAKVQLARPAPFTRATIRPVRAPLA